MTRVCFGSRLCENVHEPWMRRIVFSVVPSRWMLRALATFVSPKLRWKFYAPEQCQSFHTAWVKRRNTHPEEMFSALHLKADSSQTSRHDCFVPKPEVFNGLGHVPLAQWMSAVLSRHRYHRRAAPCTRIKHLVTCRPQYNMHLLLFVPPPGLAHLPTQFAA